MSVLSQYQSGFGRRKPGPWARVNRSHPIASGIVSCWLFNEGGGANCYDIVGRNNGVATSTGATYPTRVPGGFGASAAKTDGSTNYFKCANGYTSANGTLACWVMYLTSPTGNATVACQDGPDGLAGLGFVANTFYLAGVNSTSGTFSNSILQWYFLVGTWGSAGMKSYQNAQLVGTSIATSAPVNDATYGGLNFGCYRYSGGTLFFTNTIFDNAAVWNRALLPGEIATLYREPFCFLQQEPSGINTFTPLPIVDQLPWRQPSYIFEEVPEDIYQ